jgi:hypothetical protein
MVAEQCVYIFWAPLHVTASKTPFSNLNLKDGNCNIHRDAGKRDATNSGKPKLLFCVVLPEPPLWSSGQSSWLQIRRPRVRFPGTTRKKVVSLKRTTQPREYN